MATAQQILLLLTGLGIAASVTAQEEKPTTVMNWSCVKPRFEYCMQFLAEMRGQPLCGTVASGVDCGEPFKKGPCNPNMRWTAPVRSLTSNTFMCGLKPPADPHATSDTVRGWSYPKDPAGCIAWAESGFDSQLCIVEVPSLKKYNTDYSEREKLVNALLEGVKKMLEDRGKTPAPPLESVQSPP